MIMFTGSTRTGRKVAEAAARRLIPASLELGGKDPMIVLSDADLERAANFATYYSMQNAGQTCSAGSRLLVEQGLYEPLLERLGEAFGRLRVGPAALDLDVGVDLVLGQEPVDDLLGRVGLVARVRVEEVLVVVAAHDHPAAKPVGPLVLE